MRSVITALSMAVVLSVTGCTTSDSPADASDAYAGLDQAVVQEVFANPVAIQKIDEEPESTRLSMAQGIVRNFMVCRNAYDTYEQWLTTGERPELAPLPVPENPEEPSNGDWDVTFKALQDRLKSGEPDQLREWLTAEGSCGAWIPATPGDADGPTIRDAIEGES